tara:strand:- start:6743 stop:6916 length:174 start_codon:yes stop_codon:yes gene_type:complete
LHLAIYTFKLLPLRRFGLWLAGAVVVFIFIKQQLNTAKRSFWLCFWLSNEEYDAAII